MPKPNIFISHRWAYRDDYHSLIDKFDEYGFSHLDYSVPSHDPLDSKRVKEIEDALRAQVAQCNYFIITARMASDSRWCRFEVAAAQSFAKPILSFRPWGYTGNVPAFITEADNEGGPVGFNTPPIIRKICAKLNWPVPAGL